MNRLVLGPCFLMLAASTTAAVAQTARAEPATDRSLAVPALPQAGLK